MNIFFEYFVLKKKLLLNKAKFCFLNEWKIFVLKSFPEVNGSKALERRLPDVTDEVEEADDDDIDEICGAINEDA